MAESA